MEIAIGIIGFLAAITVMWTMTTWFGLVPWIRIASGVLCALFGVGVLFIQPSPVTWVFTFFALLFAAAQIDIGLFLLRAGKSSKQKKK